MDSYLMQKNDYISPSMPYAGALDQRPKLATSLRGWIGSAVERLRHQRMVSALEALDDRMLSDIGISRSDIPKLIARSEDRRPARAPKG